jgi:hypothetical protein
MSEIIFVTDSTNYPLSKAASVCVVQGRGPQYVQVPGFQFGESHCPDAGYKVRLDDAAGIQPLFERSDVECDVRPSGSRCAPDDCCSTCVSICEQHIAGKENRSERLQIDGFRRSAAPNRPREVKHQRDKQTAAHSAEQAYRAGHKPGFCVAFAAIERTAAWRSGDAVRSGSMPSKCNSGISRSPCRRLSAWCSVSAMGRCTNLSSTSLLRAPLRERGWAPGLDLQDEIPALRETVPANRVIMLQELRALALASDAEKNILPLVTKISGR